MFLMMTEVWGNKFFFGNHFFGSYKPPKFAKSLYNV